MPHRGHVLVIEEESCAATVPLWNSVRGEGYAVSFSSLSASAQAVARHGRPDAILLNLIAAEMAGERDRYLDAAARLAMGQGPRRLPVIAVGDTGAGDRALGISDVVATPLSARRLTTRLASLTRLATMQAEARRRIETAAEFGVAASEPVVPSADRDADVLVVGAGYRYLAIERVLASRAVIVGAFTRPTAADYLSRRAFDVILVNMKAAAAIDFLVELRRDPAFFVIPAIVLVDDREGDRFDELFAAGATEVLVESAIDANLARVTRAAVAEHRLREALRLANAREPGSVVADALTGLASRGFAMAHLSRLIEESRATGEQASVAALVLTDLADINRQAGYAAGDHLIRQVGRTLGRLVRGEDLVARYESGRFVVLLPGTAPEEAEAAMRRVLAVVRQTRFALPGADGFIVTDPAVRVLGLADEDGAEGVMRQILG